MEKQIKTASFGKSPNGVLDARYAEDRKSKSSLAFRLKSRAYESAKAFSHYSSNLENPRILDLGAAEGATMLEIHRLLGASQCIGIELSQSLIASAQPFPQNCRLIHGDAFDLCNLVEPQSFDLVTALALLEHCHDPAKLVHQAYLALRPGGLFIASCPADFWDRLSGALGLHEDHSHLTTVNRGKFEQFAAEAQLTPLHYCGFMFAPIAFLPYLKISVSTQFASLIDNLVRKMRFFNYMFVNQLFIAQRKA